MLKLGLRRVGDAFGDAFGDALNICFGDAFFAKKIRRLKYRNGIKIRLKTGRNSGLRG